MSTGFEGYLAVGSIILLLAAFLWRALGRHVTVNNNNHPVANASATSSDEERGQAQGLTLRAGIVAMGLIAVMVGAIVIAALNNHANTATPTPAPAVKIEATAVAVPDLVEEYVPVALPRVNSGFDFGPLFLLGMLAIVTIGPLYLIMRRWYTPSGFYHSVARVRPIGHSAPSGISVPLFDEAVRRVKQAHDAKQ